MAATALVALSSFGMARATNPVTYNLHLVGSTAFRGSVETAISKILTNPKASFASKSGATTTIGKADYATFTGTIGSGIYNVFVSWSGSENGVATVANSAGITQPFLSLPAVAAGNVQSTVTPNTAPATLSGGTQISTNGTGTQAVFENDKADACMSDGWQLSTPFHGSVLGSSYATLTGDVIAGMPGTSIVGIVPFKWVASKTDSLGNSYVPATYSGTLETTSGSLTATLDTPNTSIRAGSIVTSADVSFDTTVAAIDPTGTTITLSSAASHTADDTASFDYVGVSNMTDILARKMFESAGGSPGVAAQFSGSPTDANTTVIAVGRNHDSGTRNCAVLSTQIDKAGTALTLIQQYQPSDSSSVPVGTSGFNGTIAQLNLYPAETINGESYSLGQSGYSSGSLVAACFTATNAATYNGNPTIFVSYLSTGDASTALGGNAQELSYNGIYYSPTAVQNGQYTFWSYEHLYYKSGLNANLKAVANQLASQIATVDASESGLLINAAQLATRVPVTTDGAIVTR